MDTVLAYTPTMLQSNLIQSYEGKEWDEPRGQDALGSGPLNRPYEAADGWLFLAARPHDLQASPELRDLAGHSGADLEGALGERLRTRTAGEWVAALTKAGIGAHVVVPNVTALFSDAWVRSHNLVVTREHDGLGPVSTNAPTQRLSHAGAGRVASAEARFGRRERPGGNRHARPAREPGKRWGSVPRARRGARGGGRGWRWRLGLAEAVY